MNKYNILVGKNYIVKGKIVGRYASIENEKNYYKVTIIMNNGQCKTYFWTKEKLDMILYERDIRIKRHDFLKIHGVKRLTHYTKAANLESILEYGLLSLNKQQSYIGELDYYIKTNISVPNIMNFMKHINRSEDKNWVILGIDPSVIVHKLDTRFYKTSPRSFIENDEDITNNKALFELFDYENDFINRPKNIPINNSEVLIKDYIDPMYIKEIHTSKDDSEVQKIAQEKRLSYQPNSSLFIF